MCKDYNERPLITDMAWDSDFFNMHCGRCILTDLNLNLEALRCDMQEYDFVSIQNVGNKVYINKWIAENTKAYLADINIQFEKEISPKGVSCGESSTFLIVPAKDLDESMKNKLVVNRNDFSFSKFVCDPSFEERNGYLVYQQWLYNSCKDFGKYFILSVGEDGIIAYILFSISEVKATIELVNVDQQYQGQRIASAMIKAVEEYLGSQGVETLFVGTQMNNIPAMNLYHSLGFKEIARTAVFHLWNC